MNIRKQRIHSLIALLDEQKVRLSIPITGIEFREGTVESIACEASQTYTKLGRRGEWGSRDAYCTFRFHVTLPEEAAGYACLVDVVTGRESEWEQQGVNPQFLVWVNGVLQQGMDVNHREILLSEVGKAGESYEIIAEGWAGLHGGVCLFLPSLQMVDRKVESLYYTYLLLQKTADMDGQSPEVSEWLYRELCHAAALLDLRETGSDAFAVSAAEADAYLKKEVLEHGRNDVSLCCIGSTHIDVAWLWRVCHTRKKAARSFLNALNLMKQYPEYQFMSSSPILFDFIRQDYPEVYDRIRKAVGEGRFNVEGGMWLEADCNLSSGESLIRHFLYGKRFFKNEFGVDSRLLWLPDVFGYSAALPQIMKKCGVDYFITSKLSWNDTNRIPNDTFYWEGLDGSRVLAHFLTMPEDPPAADFNPWYSLYAGYIHPATVAGAWKNYQNKDLSPEVFATFGYGDGGGGSTREDCEFARRLKNGLPGVPAVHIGTPLSFMERMARRSEAFDNTMPYWQGELYFEFHRGTLTTMAEVKKNNRRAEFLMRRLELALTCRYVEQGDDYPHKELEALWKTLLLNQFHDILPGTSIREVYEDARADYRALFSRGNELLSAVRGGRPKAEDRSLIVWNDQAWKRSGIVTLPEAWAGYLVDGRPVQKTKEGAVAFIENVLSFAGRRLDRGPKMTETASELIVEKHHMENSFFCIKLDQAGGIVSFFDKRIQRELVRIGRVCNDLTAYEDRPYANDAWDICGYYREKKYDFSDETFLIVEENGPVRGCLRVERTLGQSRIIQRYYIYSDVPRLDFDTEVLWYERHTLLKTAFPVEIHAWEATYDIQFGNLTRPVHNNTSWQQAQFEVCGHKWADLSQTDFGVSLLNDCKYGYCIKNGVMELTLLRGSTWPNAEADLGEHHFTYSLYPHPLGWREGRTVLQALDLNDPMMVTEGARSVASFASVSARNVTVETVKQAEDGDGVIIRLNEFENAKTDFMFQFIRPIKAAWECDMLENRIQPLKVQGAICPMTIDPFEVKTVRLIF